MKQVHYLPCSLKTPLRYDCFVTCSHSCVEQGELGGGEGDNEDFFDKANNLANMHHVSRYHSHYLASLAGAPCGTLKEEEPAGAYVLFDSFEEEDLFLLQL